MKSEEWNISYVESSGFQLYLLVQSIATLLYWIKLQVVIPYFRLYHPLPVSIDRKEKKGGKETNQQGEQGRVFHPVICISFISDEDIVDMKRLFVVLWGLRKQWNRPSFKSLSLSLTNQPCKDSFHLETQYSYLE